jgi:MoxR-like ATPase
MNPTEARDALVRFYKINQPVMFYGDPGAGKTSMVRDVCNNASALLGHPLGLVTWNLSMMEAVDLRGLPHDNGSETVWRKPSNFPQAERDGLKGILFLDEANTARQLFPTLMQLVLDRQAGEHKLLDGWLPVIAGNYRSAKGVACDMPAPFNNRVAHIDYVPCWRFFAGELAAKIGYILLSSPMCAFAPICFR